MGVLPRVFFTMTEAAARWGYAPADIAGWAHQGQLEIVTGIAPVDCGGEPAAGLVAISVADILPMFRRSGTGPREMPVRRIRAQGKDEWMMITEPAEGVIVSMDDLMILADEVHRFETEREIFGRPHGGKGPEPKYDWDEFWRAVAIYVHEHGVPARIITQSKVAAGNSQLRTFLLKAIIGPVVPDGELTTTDSAFGFLTLERHYSARQGANL